MPAGTAGLKKHPRSVVDLDIVAQLTTIPVDMRRRPVLIEVVIAQTGIDRKVHAIFPDALLVAMAELQKLRAFAGHGDLSAPVIRHVAAEDKSRRNRDWRACAGKFRCPSVDFRRPLVFRYPVQRAMWRRRFSSVLPSSRQLGLRPLAIRQACISAAKRKVTSTGGSGRLSCPKLCEGMNRDAPVPSAAPIIGASGKLSGLAHPWLARMGNRIVDP